MYYLCTLFFRMTDMKWHKHRHILFSAFMLTLFVVYQVSVTMFSHIHYVNGVMIVHSHPSSDIEHTHTEGQVITMAQAASFVGVEPVTQLVEMAPLSFINKLNFIQDTFLLYGCSIQHFYLRAPPCAILNLLISREISV